MDTFDGHLVRNLGDRASAAGSGVQLTNRFGELRRSGTGECVEQRQQGLGLSKIGRGLLSDLIEYGLF